VEKYVAAAVNDLVPGRARLVTLGGIEIGLFLSASGYRAYRNFCPHAGAPICRGEITRAAAAPPMGGSEYPAAREILRCPWHAWEFDLETGENLAYPRCRLDAFPVEVVDGQLVVSI
jgi:nitrite reductase/ring-hydroxylating ferredoxin subunit